MAREVCGTTGGDTFVFLLLWGFPWRIHCHTADPRLRWWRKQTIEGKQNVDMAVKARCGVRRVTEISF